VLADQHFLQRVAHVLDEVPAIRDLNGVGRSGSYPLRVAVGAVAADDLDAEVFLVPEANCAEALLQVPEGLALARVATLDDALDALDDVRDGRAPPSC